MSEKGAEAAHDIRRFESAVWSLYVLSENVQLPADARAACRAAADHASSSMKPGDPGVTALIQLVIDVGGGEEGPKRELLLARLREAGWGGSPSDLDRAPPPLAAPPPRNLVSDKLRTDALERVLREIEGELRDPRLPPDQRPTFAARLKELEASPGDIRSKTERAWALLAVLQRNREARERKPPEGS